MCFCRQLLRSILADRDPWPEAFESYRSSRRMSSFQMEKTGGRAFAFSKRFVLYSSAMSGRRSFYIENFGCQMNVHDSELLAALLEADGWYPACDIREADVIILNTCSVRDKAEQKVYSRFGVLKDLKRDQPGVRFVLAGCMARAWGKKLLKRIPYLDYIVGPGTLNRLPQYLQITDRTSPLIDVKDPDSVFSVQPEMIRNPGSHSAWVTIMEGCDNFCSYCIVPYVRGRERSRREDEIIAEINVLVDRGVREITFLGQNVNSFSGSPKGFPGLLRKANDIEGLKRIRFTTSHPKDMSDELIEAVACLPKLCEYLHFPVQSGSTTVLSRMRRGYTREDYLNRVERMKRMIPEVALSSDFIVGFPGETEEDHRMTVSLIESIRYSNIFIFNYSVRKGTHAAALPDDVPADVKTRRLEDLLQRQRRISLEQNQELIGSEVEVLADGHAKRGGSLWTGRTRQNRVVNFTGSVCSGAFYRVFVESASPNCLYGRLAGQSSG